MKEFKMQEKPMLQTPMIEDLKPCTESRLYKRRWVIIVVFAFYLSLNAYHWLHLNIIGDVILKYYNASLPEGTLQKHQALDWLSLIYMLTYVVLILPSMWFLQRTGLRVAVLCGSFLNAIGAWIKVVSVAPERFGVLMSGQVVCAVAQVFTLSLPARIAAVWFGQNEVSTATAIGLIGIQVGNALGSVVPPLLVPSSEYLVEIGYNLSVLFYIGAGVSTFLFVVLLIIFRSKPPLPPSKAALKASTRGKGETNYGQSLIKLARNRDFILVCIIFAMNVGCAYAMFTLLNPIILYYFESHQKDAGVIGLAMVLSGTVGSVLSGLWLDRTKWFKSSAVGIYFFSFIGMLVYTFILKFRVLWLVYLCAGFLGLFMTGNRPVMFQLAVEVTYPESEGISSGLLNAASEVVAIISTVGMRTLMTKLSIFAANVAVCVALFLGTVISGFIRAKYKRQTADRDMQIKGDVEIEVEVNEKTKMTEC